MKNGILQEYSNGNKSWRLNDNLHRTDGPSVVREDGTKEWWLNGKWCGDGDIPPVDYTLAVLILEGLSK